MNLVITLGMVTIYIAGLCYLIFRNPMPKQDFEEFAVGGRSFGWAFITLTIVGTWYPGSLYIGWAQMGVDQGIVNTYLGPAEKPQKIVCFSIKHISEEQIRSLKQRKKWTKENPLRFSQGS